MKKRLFLGVLPFLLLASCGNKGIVFSPYAYGDLISGPFEEIAYETYARVASFSPITAKDSSIPSSLAGVYGLAQKKKVMPGLGEQYLTVIPVAFSDYPASTLDALTEGKAIDAIQNAFFGSGEGNQYVSVASYYEASSFSRLHLRGQVAPKWFVPSFGYATLSTKQSSFATKLALTEIYKEAVAWYQAEVSPTLNEGDPVYFVYCAPYAGYPSPSGNRSSMFWAFTVNDPAPIAWSSFYMGNLSDGRMDAHTFIHETGHLFGLKDYYDVNAVRDFSSVSPLGRIDMMDCSLGDHNSFSKMALGWNRPFVATSSGTVTLRQAAGNGDCLIIPNGKWNGSPFDEYLLLEFYTPTLLNRVDVQLRPDPGLRLPNKSGVKVYHVDARLGVYDEKKGEPLSLVDSETEVSGKLVDLFYDNGAGDDRYLIRLLDGSASSSALPRYYVASDHHGDTEESCFRDALFQAGQGSDSPVFSDFRFHDGKALSCGFTVTEVGAGYARISIDL